MTEPSSAEATRPAPATIPAAPAIILAAPANPATAETAAETAVTAPANLAADALAQMTVNETVTIEDVRWK